MKGVHIHPIGRLRRLTGKPTGRGLFIWLGVAPMLCVGVELMRYGALVAIGPFALALIWQTEAQMAARP